MEGNPIAWFEIYVDDMERAKQFYQTVLDTKLEELSDPTGGNMVMQAFPSDMEAYGATGALVKMDGFSARGNSILVYFASDDCALEASRVIDAGGTIHRDKSSIGEYGFIVLAVDTEGNMFGLHSLQ